jgi:hypothetical protein
MRVSVRLAQNRVVMMSSICSRATSESRAGHSVLHRTATVFLLHRPHGWSPGRESGGGCPSYGGPLAGESTHRHASEAKLLCCGVQFRHTAVCETRCLFAITPANSNKCCFGSGLRLRWYSDAVKGKDVAVQQFPRMVRPRAKGWQSKHGT